MWSYQKTLQYPVNIKNPNPALAKLIITQLGGPDGELGASLRYLSQRYAMPYKECMGILTDIGTEELGHMEMISAIVYQLTRNLTPEQKYYLMGKQYEAEKAAHAALAQNLQKPPAGFLLRFPKRHRQLLPQDTLYHLVEVGIHSVDLPPAALLLGLLLPQLLE